ncbi:hypothetical protein BKA70DRAFT_1315459, partial [Coprinopsis sp. MPI-PUGE-AT-0042]
AKPSMPLEVLYKIIDDNWQQLAEDSGRGLIVLTHTCHALATYCRPFLFHSITLYTLDSPIPQMSWLGPITRAEGFSRLVNMYPSSASLVKELRIVVLKPYPPKEQRVLKKLGIDMQRGEMKAWQILLKASYPGLSILRLIISWNHVSPLLTNALFKAIKTMPTLEILELSGSNAPLQYILPSLPPTLKHFSLLGGGTVPSSPYEWTPPGCGPDLESLTLAAWLHPIWLLLILSPESETPPLSLKGLTHLQTWPLNPVSEIAVLNNFPSTTLRCLHFHLNSSQFFGLPLAVARFSTLTHLECIMDGNWNKYNVNKVFSWLDRSLMTLGARPSPEVMERLSKLTICLLFRLEGETHLHKDDIYRKQLESSQSIFSTARWQYLELTNIVGFMTIMRYPKTAFPGYFIDMDTPRPLSTIRGASVASYDALWKSCGCSGRRFCL